MNRVVLAFLLAGGAFAQSPKLTLPNKPDSLKVLVLGDTGTGGREQYDIAVRAHEYQKVFPFKLAILLGDNMYGGESTRDFESKFERPYKPLIGAGVKFQAALGNHDNPNQRFYKLFNMNGERYYTFKPMDGVRFFALDSTYVSKEQIEWLRKELQSSGSDWKVCFFHHPMYSSGKRHGPDDELRSALEPLMIEHGVSVVFTGHEHFYERLKPQKGIQHFIQGASAKLRESNISPNSPITAKGFDSDRSFMLIEFDGGEMHFQTIARSGATVDSGVVKQRVLEENRSRAQEAAK